MKHLLALVLGLMMTGPVAADTWAAFAAGTGVLNNGQNYAKVAVGVGDTRRIAMREAMKACKLNGCQIVWTMNNGCGFVTTGSGYNGLVVWGGGSTPDRAIAEVQARGAVQVKEPVGACGRPY